MIITFADMGITVCGECGALVSDTVKHQNFHDVLLGGGVIDGGAP